MVLNWSQVPAGLLREFQRSWRVDSYLNSGKVDSILSGLVAALVCFLPLLRGGVPAVRLVARLLLVK